MDPNPHDTETSLSSSLEASARPHPPREPIGAAVEGRVFTLVRNISGSAVQFQLENRARSPVAPEMAPGCATADAFQPAVAMSRQLWFCAK